MVYIFYSTLVIKDIAQYAIYRDKVCFFLQGWLKIYVSLNFNTDYALVKQVASTSCTVFFFFFFFSFFFFSF